MLQIAIYIYTRICVCVCVLFWIREIDGFHEVGNIPADFIKSATSDAGQVKSAILRLLIRRHVIR